VNVSRLFLIVIEYGSEWTQQRDWARVSVVYVRRMQSLDNDGDKWGRGGARASRALTNTTDRSRGEGIPGVCRSRRRTSRRSEPARTATHRPIPIPWVSPSGRQVIHK
jgi:hypothetical protein